MVSSVWKRWLKVSNVGSCRETRLMVSNVFGWSVRRRLMVSNVAYGVQTWLKVSNVGWQTLLKVSSL
jgi:hypothetical protein